MQAVRSAALYRAGACPDCLTAADNEASGADVSRQRSAARNHWHSRADGLHEFARRESAGHKLRAAFRKQRVKKSTTADALSLAYLALIATTTQGKPPLSPVLSCRERMSARSATINAADTILFPRIVVIGSRTIDARHSAAHIPALLSPDDPAQHVPQNADPRHTHDNGNGKRRLYPNAVHEQRELGQTIWSKRLTAAAASHQRAAFLPCSEPSA
jgi:hypothetical protein